MNRRSNNSSIDWLELDRLVDGRLNDDAYRQLLCQIDADPDGWKQCALAFLEHQALEKELSIFGDDSSSQMLPLMGAGDLDSGSDLSETEEMASPAKRNSSPISAVVGWMSMALCIFGGLALGFTMNSEFHDQLPPNTIPNGVVNNINNTVAHPPGMASMNDDSDDPSSSAKDRPDCKHRRKCCSQRNRMRLANNPAPEGLEDQ